MPGKLLMGSLAVGMLLIAMRVLPAEESTSAIDPAERAAIIEALEHFNGLIGEWRGVGQPQRQSNKGSWQEKATWVWDLKGPRPAVRYQVKDGKFLEEAWLTYDPAEKLYLLEARLPGGQVRKYRGHLKDSRLALESSIPDENDRLFQIVLTQLNEKRTLVLFQSRTVKQRQFDRIAEVGYTRAGTRLAQERVDGPECIVTGGKGTMSVEYKGKTYWFCCTGCRDAFNDDPEGILEEAAKRAEKNKAKSAGNND